MFHVELIEGSLDHSFKTSSLEDLGYQVLRALLEGRRDEAEPLDFSEYGGFFAGALTVPSIRECEALGKPVLIAGFKIFPTGKVEWIVPDEYFYLTGFNERDYVVCRE